MSWEIIQRTIPASLTQKRWIQVLSLQLLAFSSLFWLGDILGYYVLGTMTTKPKHDIWITSSPPEYQLSSKNLLGGLTPLNAHGKKSENFEREFGPLSRRWLPLNTRGHGDGKSRK